MKKQIYLMILIVANLLFSQSLMSQSGTHKFSVVGGPIYSSIIGDSESWIGSIGAQGGVIINIVNLGKEMSVRAELNISFQGAKWEEDFDGVIYKGKTTLLYANVPLVLRYQTESGFYGEAGIQPGLLLSAKDKEDGVSYDYKEYFSKLDIGIPLGVGYEFNNNLGVGVRVIPGITNVNSGDWESWTDHNLIVALRVTYTFKKK